MNAHLVKISIFIYTSFIIGSCKKFIEIAPPIDTITTEQVFESNKQAEWAIAGVYSRMINGDETFNIPTFNNFYAGLSNITGSMSADELVNTNGVAEVDQYVVNINSLSVQNSALTNQIWKSAYKTIYDANGVIEGIEGSISPNLTDSARKQITGEAKAIRAFAYFYLTNSFGDLPLVLTIDFNKTKNLPRVPQAEIYAHILKDLFEARDNLKDDYSIGNLERIRINKWFVEAFLSRVYLYLGQYQDAINSATAVINKTDLFHLEPDVNSVFLKNSNEAIWQLAQSGASGQRGTPEGRVFVPELVEVPPRFNLTDELLGIFEVDDSRFINWVRTVETEPGIFHHYPYKYKTGREGGDIEEYSTVMRLAELYLIRAEANIMLSGANTTTAIADVNMIRQRAGIDDLPLTLSAEQVITAIAEERRKELFVEGAHRWFDLKRTGKAGEVLSAIPSKQPWRGDFQLLYPVPRTEIDVNIQLSQNPQYNNF